GPSKLTERNQHETLWIGRQALAVTVVDSNGRAVPGAYVLEQDELLGTTDQNGEVQLLALQSGPVDAIANGFDCAQVTVAELRATHRIVLPALTTLVVDARQAARALGRASVAINGAFSAPCCGRLSSKLLLDWNERPPSSSIRSSMKGMRTKLNELNYEVDADHVLTLVGLFQAGQEIHISLRDRCDGRIGSAKSVVLRPGETTVVELPTPATVRSEEHTSEL